MATLYNMPRGTRARLNTLIFQSAIVPGREYLITDENRVVVGVTTTSVIELLRRTEEYMDLTATAPGLPAAGATRIYRGDVGGRGMARMVGSDGDFATLMPHLGRNNPALLIPSFASSSFSSIGFPALQILGTATARNFSPTTRFTRTRRVGYLGSTTQYTSAGIYTSVPMASTGVDGNYGGFHFICRFSCADISTNASMFIGLSGLSAAPSTGSAEPIINETNALGIAKISTSANLGIISNGTSTSTSNFVSLGSNFPGQYSASADIDMYEFVIYAPMQPTSSVLPSWMVTRFLNDGTSLSASGTFNAGTTANGPAATAPLYPRLYRKNNTATAAVLDIIGAYLETDV